MTEVSGYLRNLPPVLWQDDPAPPAFSLSAALRIFEKILTGIDDGVPIVHGDHTHDAVQDVIDRLPRLYQPWATPREFLPWLASWLDLDFPDIWDEYQRRKITSQITGIYQRRGLKDGLNQYLDLYTVAATRPRVAVDDGSKVLTTTLAPGQRAPVQTLVSQGPYHVPGQAVTVYQGLVAPLAIAHGPDGALYVGDSGTPTNWTGPTVGAGVWRLSAAGQYTWTGVPPLPQRLAGATFRFPVGLATDIANPWNLWVLDQALAPGSTVLYRLASPGFTAAVPVATNTQLGVVWPVAMALDLNGHLLVLDRGALPPNPAAAQVIDVTTGPLGAIPHPLAQVIEPLSLLVQPGGQLVIGDAREQDQPTPADLVLVDRGNAWAQTRLLANLASAANPLLAPVALIRPDATHLVVLDVGLKPYHVPLASPYERVAAEQASVYLADLQAAPPAVTLAAEQKELVFPTGMATDGTVLYLADRGDYADPQLAGPRMRVWRALPHEIGITVYFSSQRPTTQLQRRQIVNDIFGIVTQHQPVQSLVTFVYEV
jgi:phage tail-like protein